MGFQNSTTDDFQTGIDLTECCRKCESNTGTDFSSKHLVVTGCVAFVAGVFSVLLILVVLKLKREKKLLQERYEEGESEVTLKSIISDYQKDGGKLGRATVGKYITALFPNCFKEKEEPFRGKWEGASKRATIQVLKKHTLERSQDTDVSLNVDQSRPEMKYPPELTKQNNEDTILKKETETQAKAKTEDIDREHECVVNIIEEPNEKAKEEEKVSPVKNDQPEIKITTETAPMDDNDMDNDPLDTDPSDNVTKSEPTETDCTPRTESHLFEKSRGSSVFEPGDLILQNSNFRISALSNI